MISAAAGVTLKSAGGIRSSANLESIFWKSSLSSGFSNEIEIAPLAFMRGRTLSGAFIILDEAQNTTREQMKMFLTRIGFGSTAVITGDATQVDLPRGVRSGLRHVMGVLEGVPGITFTHFTSKDVVRHPLVQRIVDAYEH